MDKGIFSDDGDGQFDHAPYLNFNDDKAKFDTNDVSNANDNYGSASFFAPKSLFCQLQKAFIFWMPFVLLDLPADSRSQPPAQHSSDFIYTFLQKTILFIVDCLSIFHKPDKNAKDVEF